MEPSDSTESTVSSPSAISDHQLLFQLITTLQYEATSRDGPVRFITESRLEEEDILQAWIALMQSFGASMVNLPGRVVRGVDHPKLLGNLDYFLAKYNDERFKEHFRVNKTTFLFLFTNLESALEANGESSGKPRIRGDVQLAATLW